MRMWKAPTNFGSEKDTSLSKLIARLLDLKFARRATPSEANFKSGALSAVSSEDHVDEGEQEQPHHVDEVPVPGGRLEAEVLLRREAAGQQPRQADRQEDRPNQHVEAVEAGRHEEGRAVEAGVRRALAAEEIVVLEDVVVLVGLDRGEQHAQADGQEKAD